MSILAGCLSFGFANSTVAFGSVLYNFVGPFALEKI